VPHVGEIKPVVSLVANPGKASLEGGRDSVWVRARIGCAEVEIALVPFREQIGDVVELRLLGRRFHVFGLQMLVNELLSFPAQLGFHRVRRLGLLRFRRTVDPGFTTLWHGSFPEFEGTGWKPERL